MLSHSVSIEHSLANWASWAKGVRCWGFALATKPINGRFHNMVCSGSTSVVAANNNFSKLSWSTRITSLCSSCHMQLQRQRQRQRVQRRGAAGLEVVKCTALAFSASALLNDPCKHRKLHGKPEINRYRNAKRSPLPRCHTPLLPSGSEWLWLRLRLWQRQLSWECCRARGQARMELQSLYWLW